MTTEQNEGEGSALAEVLRSFMRVQGWSAAQFARAAGVHPSNLSLWLRGEQRPDLTSAMRLARTTRRPLEEILILSGRLSPDDLAGWQPSELDQEVRTAHDIAAQMDPEQLRWWIAAGEGILRQSQHGANGAGTTPSPQGPQ